MTPGQIQAEIEAHLKAFHLPSMHVTALAGLIVADVVEPAIRAERERCAQFVLTLPTYADLWDVAAAIRQME